MCAKPQSLPVLSAFEKHCWDESGKEVALQQARAEQQPLYLVTALVQIVTRKQPATIIQPQPPSGGLARGAMLWQGDAPLPPLSNAGWFPPTHTREGGPRGCSPSAKKQAESSQDTELWNVKVSFPSKHVVLKSVGSKAEPSELVLTSGILHQGDPPGSCTLLHSRPFPTAVTHPAAAQSCSSPQQDSSTTHQSLDFISNCSLWLRQLYFWYTVRCKIHISGNMILTFV